MSDWKNVQYKDGKMRTSEGGGGGGSSTFAGLEDVSLSNLQNGQVPKYNSDTHKWENADESGGGGTVTDVTVDGISVVNPQTGVAEIEMPTPPSVPNELSDLSDVQFSNLADHQPLRYNATSQKWVNGADGFPPLIYSDEEREVGVWRDGKPLYQRTLRCIFTEDYYDFTIDSTSQIKVVEGLVYASSGDYGCIHLGYGNIQADKVQACQASSTIFRVQNSYYASRDVGEFTVCYTKTTDTAGSGTWTTQGGYAHHYSTSEKVVGTWIDGKPLYEKVIQANCSFTSRFNGDIYAGNVDLSSYLPSDIDKAFVITDKSYYMPLSTQKRTFYFAQHEKDNGYGRFYCQVMYSRSNVDCIFTIQYTKTTD